MAVEFGCHDIVHGVSRDPSGYLVAIKGEGGIRTVLDLARLDPATVRSRWSPVLERRTPHHTTNIDNIPVARA